MQKNDIVNVVDIHLQSFQGFFLSTLGSQFLNELYSGILIDENGIALVARQENGQVIGFVAGTSHPNQFYKRLLIKRWWAFAIAAIPSLLKNPRIFMRLMRAFQKPGERTNCQSAELMSIAVHPKLQGGGAGKLLVNIFIQEARSRGCQNVILTTDALNNNPVNTFYMNCGFLLNRQFLTPENRLMNEYILRLDGISLASG